MVLLPLWYHGNPLKKKSTDEPATLKGELNARIRLNVLLPMIGE